MLENNSSTRWKFYFVLSLTLIRVPLILLFLAVSVFGGHPLPEPRFVVAFAAMLLIPSQATCAPPSSATESSP